MQLKYNRQQSLGSTLFKIFIKLFLLAIVIIIAIFLIEKVNFPSPEKKYDIDVTNDIKKLLIFNSSNSLKYNFPSY